MADSEKEQWETVAEARSKLIFDTDGDEWEGVFEGPEIIVDPNTGEEYPYLNFRGNDGEAYTTSSSYQLSRAFEKIPVGTYSKIIRKSSIKVAKGDMINFKVQIRK